MLQSSHQWSVPDEISGANPLLKVHLNISKMHFFFCFPSFFLNFLSLVMSRLLVERKFQEVGISHRATLRWKRRSRKVKSSGMRDRSCLAFKIHKWWRKAAGKLPRHHFAPVCRDLCFLEAPGHLMDDNGP